MDVVDVRWAFRLQFLIVAQNSFAGHDLPENTRLAQSSILP
jgi:hypothetical protein